MPVECGDNNSWECRREGWPWDSFESEDFNKEVISTLIDVSPLVVARGPLVEA